MLSTRCPLLLALLAASGCLLPGKAPEGRKLASGRDIGAVGFLQIDGSAWVSFNRQKALGTPAKGGVSDLWIAGPVDAASLFPDPASVGVSSYQTQERLVIANRSDRWGGVTAGGSLFTMVDERQVTGAGGGQLESVGTLVRLDSQYQPNVRFENVSTFTLDYQYDNRLLFRQVPATEDPPGLFLWDGQDQLRLGDVANASLLNMQVADSGMAYFVLGGDRMLSRLGKLTDTIQPLHVNVNRFLLRGDEKYATLSLSNAGTSTTVVLEVDTGREIPLARPNPCCWLGFTDSSSNQFTYSQSKSDSAAAEYHTLDLASGTDTTLVLPDPLVDLASFMSRPHSDEVLYLDSQGHGVFFGQTDQQQRRTVDAVMMTPRFSPDGRYLIYVSPQLPTKIDPDPHGPLMVQDADLVDLPRQLTTPGMAVRPGSYFFIDGPDGPILVFWSSIVRSTADLYFANHETGDLKVVAVAIGNVTVDSKRIVGTVNLSAQDATGDLVVSDVQDSGRRTMAHAVSEWTQWNGLVGYVVRGRASSDHDGLWGSILDPPGQDGGQ